MIGAALIGVRGNVLEQGFLKLCRFAKDIRFALVGLGWLPRKSPRELYAVLLFGELALLDQPVPQTERRVAVLLVVVLDLGEQLRVALLQPLLEHQDGGTCLLDLSGASLVVASLNLLQRVAGSRDPQGLVDDPIEVDEDVLTQQSVNLILATACRPINPASPVRSEGPAG